MNQTKLESLVEATINILSGWVVALLLWTFVVSPLWGFDSSMMDNLLITSMFTAVSIIRSYFWRRFFNAGLHKAVHKFVGGVLHGTRKTI